jgi:hypothetical protein
VAQRRPDRFTALRRDLARTREVLDAKIGSVHDELTRTREVLDAKIDSVRDELRVEIQRSAEESRRQAEESRRQAEESRRQAEETRRHFDVIAEGLLSQLQLVAEGVVTGTRSQERFGGDVDDRFRIVDGRLLRLEARVFDPPEP